MVMSKGKILVVDPDEQIRWMMETYFTGQGYEVVCVADGKTALDMTFPENLPDVIVMEKKLPDMDWYELARPYADRKIPIFFFEEDYRKSTMSYMAQYAIDVLYIVKPFDIEWVKERIQSEIKYAYKLRNIGKFDAISIRPKSKLTIEHLNQVRKHSSKWVYLILTIQKFEAFCDVFGQAAGDGVIRTVSYVLGEVVDKVGTQDDFIGYPEPNHFVVITQTHNVAQLKRKLIEKINREIIRHYNLVDRKLGYIQRGDEQVELMSLAITEFPHTYFSEQWDVNLPPKQA
jgi:PleD family two-component response regulator